MSELINTVRGAITLDIPTLVRFRDSEDVFRRGVTILVLVALVVGLVTFAVDFIGSFFAPSAEAEIARVSQVFEQALQFMPPGAGEAFQEQFLRNFEVGIEIGRKVDALPTRLPKVVGNLFQALSGWVDRPLGMLGGFLGYGIWVMLAAKLLGGKGRLQEFLGTAALSSVPYLLLILEKVPCLGGILGIVAWIWSSIIWVAATAVSHGWAVPQATAEGVVEGYQISWGKAILAVILPVLALAVLVVVGAIVLGLIIAVASAGD
jgi:hypothetical protein